MSTTPQASLPTPPSPPIKGWASDRKGYGSSGGWQESQARLTGHHRLQTGILRTFAKRPRLYVTFSGQLPMTLDRKSVV